eukprot:c22370_g1_i1 orf=121-1674(+)
MLLAMGSRCYYASSTEGHSFTLPRDSSNFQLAQLRGQAPSHRVSLRNQACRSLMPLDESWRTWISEDLHWASLAADFCKFSRFQPIRLLGFSSHSLQINGSHTLAPSDDNGWALSHKVIDSDRLQDDIGCSEVEKVSCSNSTHAKNILPFLGRALLILGLGLGLSTPASARTVVPTVSTVSTGDTVMQRDEATMRQEGVNGDDVQEKPDASLHDSSTASHRDVDTSDSAQLGAVDAASNNPKIAEDSEDRLRLSEAFWRGIPTPEESLLYNLKMHLDKHPSDTRALESLLQAVMEQRDMLRALTVLETLLEVQPENLKWKFLKARTHEFLGELLMAKEEYEELLSLSPLSARFMQGLVMLLNKVGAQKEALELIQTALNRALSENKNVEARNLGVLLSQFYIQLGNFENALQYLGSMIEQDPDDFRPYLCQGLAYALMDQMDKAKQNFRKYMQLCPPDAFDQNYFDSLMLKAHAQKQADTYMKAAMKAAFRNRKKSKPMKQPSLARKFSSDDGVLSE